MEKLFTPDRIIVFDGGLATLLEEKGETLDKDLWSALVVYSNPNLLQQVHYEYYMAGADIGISASYQMSFEGFLKKGFSAMQAKMLMLESVHIASRARDLAWKEIRKNYSKRCRPIVAASLGCYGAALADGSEYNATYRSIGLAKLMEWHARKFDVFASEDVADILAFETIPCVVEVEAILNVLMEYETKVDSKKLVAYITVACKDEYRLNSGEPVADLNKVLGKCTPNSLIGVGINCTAPQYVALLLHALELPLGVTKIAYPNSGETWDAHQNAWIDTCDKSFGEFCSLAKNWVEAGALAIGGCCRTNTRHISYIANKLK